MICCVSQVACAIDESQETVHPGTEYKLYYLGGQSNMEGYGFVSELPDDWLGEADRVMIYTGRMAGDNERGGGVGIWESLRPGHGMGLYTDGQTNKLSNRFGPELTFGRKAAELNPTSNIAIIKYSRGGSASQIGASGYGSWDPDFDAGDGINQYDNALTAIRAALSQIDINGDGSIDHLTPSGIIWMQGEADAYHSQASAEAYQANLKRMMDLLRAAFRVDDLPVVIGKITDSGQADDGKVMDYIEIVQDAQKKYAATDKCATLVTVTDDLQYLEDGWHYDTDGFIRLGVAFAEAARELEFACENRRAPP